MQAPPAVTASILVYNSPLRQIRTAIDCLKADGVEKIYLVYNGPEKGYITPGRFPEAEIIITENRGYGAGHNVALRKALNSGSRYHLVMNADVRWEGNVVQPMTAYMGEHPDVGLMSPRTLHPDGSLQYTCRLLPTPLDIILRRLPRTPLIRHRMETYLLADKDPGKILGVSYLLGNFLLFSTEALRSAGLFDERFFMYPEDIDISRRIRAAGYDVLYWPMAGVIHDHCRASARNFRMFAIHLKNMIVYFNKWGWFRDKDRRRANRATLEEVRNQGHRESASGKRR